ncbi:MAG TPA: hypothetical protein VHP35_04475, partial [Terriglobia bacterium]|nr:hypothetical protein [Terriglobia bacterium]
PKGQHWLAMCLLGALAIVVFGSLIGEFAGIHGWIQSGWHWFGNQGFEYLDLGRFWQTLLVLGLTFWVVMLFRVLRGRLKMEHRGNMPWMFFYAALAIPAFYGVGLLAQTTSHTTVADYWRWWVVHFWVEDFLELFTTVIVAYLFVLLGVVHEKVALQLIYLDFIIYSAGLGLFCMRYLIPAARWSDRAAKFSFWTLNLGLAWMSFATLFPLGIAQLYHSVNAGYFEARSLQFLTTEMNTLLEWMRLPGDAVFIVGILPIVHLAWTAVRHRVAQITLEEPEKVLLVEVTERAETEG